MADSPHVFVIDDGAQGGEAVRPLARSLGVNAVVYESARAFLEAYQGAPGCLVAPLSAGERHGSGANLQDELSRRGAHLPVVLFAARPAVAAVVGAMRAGAVTVLDIPWDNVLLEQALREALALDVQRRRRRAQQDEIRRRLATLNAKERQVLDSVVAGKANKAIASQLGASLRTVENRRRIVFTKLGVRSVAELVATVIAAEGEPRP
jgi:FixJ family two-component response regulator